MNNWGRLCKNHLNLLCPLREEPCNFCPSFWNPKSTIFTSSIMSIASKGRVKLRYRDSSRSQLYPPSFELAINIMIFKEISMKYFFVMQCDAIRWEQFLLRCRLGQRWQGISGWRQHFRPNIKKQMCSDYYYDDINSL